jgi:hypothetical protein
MLKRHKQPTRWKCRLAIFIGLGMLLMCVYMSIAALLLLRYESTRGKVLTTRIKQTTTAKGGKLYKPVVEYSYRVNGVEYRNDVYISLDFVGEGDDDFANQVLLQFRPQAACTVYFNPSHPQESVLTVKPGMGYWGFILLFACFGSVVSISAMLQLKELTRSGIIRPGKLS